MTGQAVEWTTHVTDHALVITFAGRVDDAAASLLLQIVELEVDDIPKNLVIFDTTEVLDPDLNLETFLAAAAQLCLDAGWGDSPAAGEGNERPCKRS